MRTNAEAELKQRARFGPSKTCFSQSILSLTIPRRFFCCGFLMLYVIMSMCILSPAVWSPE